MNNARFGMRTASLCAVGRTETACLSGVYLPFESSDLCNASSSSFLSLSSCPGSFSFENCNTISSTCF
uniref:Uncharacterized protein n=1 Tax=Anguilla anguilla TaxID=7936 RepID=A0A0E9SD37_ANGAN